MAFVFIFLAILSLLAILWTLFSQRTIQALWPSRWPLMAAIPLLLGAALLSPYETKYLRAKILTIAPQASGQGFDLSLRLKDIVTGEEFSKTLHPPFTSAVDLVQGTTIGLIIHRYLPGQIDVEIDERFRSL